MFKINRTNTSTQRHTFNELVCSGVYDRDFEHPPHAKRFVAQIFQNEVMQSLSSKSISILDCGCGTGAWLKWLNQLMQDNGIKTQLYGFDIADNMVKVSDKNLSNVTTKKQIRQGDLLDRNSYVYDDVTSGFNIIFTYDSIQQLRPVSQIAACKIMVENMAPGGVLVIFDHDSNSRYGRMMARKKFLTRYFGLRLVPRYYCNAKYPPLSKFRAELKYLYEVDAKIVEAPDGKKRALIVTSEAGNNSA